MIYYRYYLIKDKKLKQIGQTSNMTYILNLIKYKRKSKRYILFVDRFLQTIENDITVWKFIDRFYSTRVKESKQNENS